MTYGINDNVGHGKSVKSDHEVLMSRDDREMILRQHLWPNKTTLPLTNRNRKNEGESRLGFLRIENPLTVYNGLIYRDPATLPTIQYASVDDLLADGWIVD